MNTMDYVLAFVRGGCLWKV